MKALAVAIYAANALLALAGLITGDWGVFIFHAVILWFGVTTMFDLRTSRKPSMKGHSVTTLNRKVPKEGPVRNWKESGTLTYSSAMRAAFERSRELWVLPSHGRERSK